MTGHPIDPAALACPHCPDPDSPLRLLDPGVLGCPHGHRFDVARQGYVSLLAPRARTDTADTADMVAARADFLARGHFAPIAAAVAAAVPDGPVLEIGAGPGYYLAAVLDRHPGQAGIALDASRFAARRAAADPRVSSVVADAWSRLPVRSSAVGAVLSVFAPRAPGEVRRVLRPGGVLVAVTPEPDHLAEVRGPLGMLTIDEGKPERLQEQFRDLLVRRAQERVRTTATMAADDLSALVRMGPSAHHVDRHALAERIAALELPVAVTVSVTVTVFAPGPG